MVGFCSARAWSIRAHVNTVSMKFGQETIYILAFLLGRVSTAEHTDQVAKVDGMFPPPGCDCSDKCTKAAGDTCELTVKAVRTCPYAQKVRSPVVAVMRCECISIKHATR